ncbi:MAG: hypothetical protein OXD50_14805 [Chloroflexi bacterium]|nr:hypothetical protein [Chloroflexota bacterium]
MESAARPAAGPPATQCLLGPITAPHPLWFAVGLDLGLARCGSEAVQDAIVEAERPGQDGAESLAPTAAVPPAPRLEPRSVLQRDSTAPGADHIHQVE